MSELAGGLLTALGLFGPLGPIAMLGPMGIATGKVHWGEPIWVAEGGAELPVTNVAIGLGLALTGPGRYSLDRLLGIRVPGALAALAMVGVVAGAAYALAAQPSPPPESEQAEEAGAELQAGQG